MEEFINVCCLLESDKQEVIDNEEQKLISAIIACLIDKVVSFDKGSELQVSLSHVNEKERKRFLEICINYQDYYEVFRTFKPLYGENLELFPNHISTLMKQGNVIDFTTEKELSFLKSKLNLNDKREQNIYYQSVYNYMVLGFFYSDFKVYRVFNELMPELNIVEFKNLQINHPFYLDLEASLSNEFKANELGLFLAFKAIMLFLNKEGGVLENGFKQIFAEMQKENSDGTKNNFFIAIECFLVKPTLFDIRYDEKAITNFVQAASSLSLEDRKELKNSIMQLNSKPKIREILARIPTNS